MISQNMRTGPRAAVSGTCGATALAVALAAVAAMPAAGRGEEETHSADGLRRVPRLIAVGGAETAAAPGEKLPDPLAGTPAIRPEQTGQDADAILARMLPPRTDSWADWNAPLEPLHRCGEPRALPPCVPPPPCHPSLPPAPYDLVGVAGEPSCGPIYRGPCEPRTGTHDQSSHPRLHRAWDRLFDCFYMWK